MAVQSRGFWAHIHAPKVYSRSLCFTATFGLGVGLLSCMLLLFFTGALLLFTYIPSMQGAYSSLQEITWSYPYGHFIRTVHNISGTVFVILLVLHFFRVLWAGAYGGKRYKNYVIGISLMGLGLCTFVTGYILPMDQVAYWALTVGLTLLEYFPAGNFLKHLVLGGATIDTPTVVRLYFMHVAVFPLLLVLLSFLHLWRVRKDKGLYVQSKKHSVQKLTADPHAYIREATLFIVTVIAILLIAHFFPASLEPQAAPLYPPNPVKAIWLLVGTQELLSYSVFWGGVIPIVLCSIFFIFYPRVACDQYGHPIQPRRYFLFSAAISVTAIYIGCTIVAIWFRGPNWLLLY